ncbi:rhombosortase [Roseateles sp. BYS87W]|uniref:Rhombosortase n=1 Tax=Pelomonas baiyunensis TaxID=3299026 RepID=A0ABW7H143_9BURK
MSPHLVSPPPTGPRTWLALCAGLAGLAVLAWLWPGGRDLLAWRPDLAVAQPWRLLTAALVHWSPLHLAANLAGCAVLALLGARAGLHARHAAAGVLAWPLTQAGLWLRPDLTLYAGLSGVLHGLTVVAALALLQQAGRPRRIGAAVLGGLTLKLWLETPWGAAVQSVAGYDFAVAPFAHLSGAIAGALACALTAWPPRAADNARI